MSIMSPSSAISGLRFNVLNSKKCVFRSDAKVFYDKSQGLLIIVQDKKIYINKDRVVKMCHPTGQLNVQFEGALLKGLLSLKLIASSDVAMHLAASKAKRTSSQLSEDQYTYDQLAKKYLLSPMVKLVVRPVGENQASLAKIH